MQKIPFLFLLFSIKLLHGQVVFDGKITEPEWGMPLSTASGGPSPCFGNGCRLNSLFASADNDNLLFAVGGNVQAGKQILLFIDSKPGGYKDGAFAGSGAPAGLDNFNNATIFDPGFSPDYCLLIHTDNTRSDYFFNLCELGGTNRFIGSAFENSSDMIGSNASDNDYTKGFEIALPRAALEFNGSQQQEVKLMAMLISDAGFLDNQFLASAATGENCYTTRAIDFSKQAPDPVVFQPDQLLPITFTYFRTAQRNNGVILLWGSAIENNLYEYEIQHSEDAIVFNKMGSVSAVGNSNTASKYEYPDKNPKPGKNYYRIKAIDKSGRTAYSPVAKLQYGYIDNTLGIFPNPVKNNINLQLTGIAKGVYNLVIYNDMGQRIIVETIEYSGGYGVQQIPLLPNMTKGPYRLLLSNKRVFYKQIFVVQ